MNKRLIGNSAILNVLNHFLNHCHKIYELYAPQYSCLVANIIKTVYANVVMLYKAGNTSCKPSPFSLLKRYASFSPSHLFSIVNYCIYI